MALGGPVDGCRRRPNCQRRLIYLDTSTVGELAVRNPAAEPLAKALGTAIERERAICVGSPWHDDEMAMLVWADPHVQTLRTYTLDLRMRHEDQLIGRELHAAARQFSGERCEITWREAFRHDPDDPPLTPFQASYLNERQRFERPAALREDVEHDRSTSESLTEAHVELRGAGLSWEDVALGNLDAQVKYYLGLLADPRFLEKAEARQADLVREWLTGSVGMEPGSPTRRYLRSAEVASAASRLREQYPAVAEDPSGFCASDEVRQLPTMRLFSFLLAALSVDGRQTKPSASDLHDLRHLTYGLSRCDVVTADKRSCRLARKRGLVPPSVRLIEATSFDDIADAVEQAVAS